MDNKIIPTAKGESKIIGQFTVTPRYDDFHACLTDDPKIWGNGVNADEAIGDCYRTAITFGYALTKAVRS